MVTKGFGNADGRRRSADERTSELEYDAADLEMCASKIEKQAKFQVGSAKVVQALLAVNTFDAGHGLDFYNQGVFDQQVLNVVSDNHQESITERRADLLRRPYHRPRQAIQPCPFQGYVHLRYICVHLRFQSTLPEYRSNA